MDCWKCSLWYSIVASQLLYIRLHECCKQLKRPVAVIPQCSCPETRSLETAGMSSFSLSLSFATNFPSLLVSLSFCMSFLAFFLSVLGMCKQSPTALLPLSSPTPILPVHAHAEGERADPGVMHTDMTICHWHRGQCKQWEQCMWQNEKAERGRQTPPLFFFFLLPPASLTYTLAFTYKYIHKALLPWQRVFSYLGMVPFPMQKQFIKNPTCPPLFPVSCQPATVDWFPSPAVNGEGLCLPALLLAFSLHSDSAHRGSRLVPTMDFTWCSTAPDKLRSNQRWICAIVFAFAGALLTDKCMWLLLAAVPPSHQDCGGGCLSD